MFTEITGTDIDDIDFDKLHDHIASVDLPHSTFPIEKGVYHEVDIPVNKVAIDPSWFDSIGVAESMLRDLVELDKTTNNRIIKAEIITSWSTADYYGLDRESDNDSLLKLEPLNDTESIVIYLHGGGFIFGSPGAHRELSGQISIETHLRCITIDYRKAPKYPFPTPLYDSLISFLYFVKNGFKPENIILSGDSAGGHLLTTLLFMLRRINMHRIRGAIIISPVIDLYFPQCMSIEANRKYDDVIPTPIDDPTSIQRLFYKPGAKLTHDYIEELKDPFVSPVYGDFSDFPSTLIQAGNKEVLIGHSRVLYDKIKAKNPEETIVIEELKDGTHAPHYMFKSGAIEGFSGIKRFVESI